MPSWDLFEAQSQSYRDEVLPPRVTARLAVELGVAQGWSRYTGDRGDMLGIVDRFGASAPAETLLRAIRVHGRQRRRARQEAARLSARFAGYAETKGRDRIHFVATHFSPPSTARLACSEAGSSCPRLLAYSK